ncbi:MAG: bifunctional ornithine acetyltransferase/N-acetylglutamate synthase, partial [Planctomycetota bacterium]
MPPAAPPIASAKSSLTAPRGFRAAGGTCGIKPSGKPDLALLAADAPCAAAGVFTRNRLPGAAVRIGKRHLARARKTGGGVRAVVCNSGNANVATGRRESQDALAMCRAAADALGCDPRQVLPASTGVIGRPLPIDRITDGVAALAGDLRRGPKADAGFASGILTTDTRTKTAMRRVTLGASRVTLGGATKGAAMIAPNMATTLGFVTCDAKVAPDTWQAMLSEAASATYNRVSIDGDQSTSDTIYALASGWVGGRTVSSVSGKSGALLRDALTDLLRELAESLI